MCTVSASPVMVTLRVDLVTWTELDGGSFMKSGGAIAGAAAFGATYFRSAFLTTVTCPLTATLVDEPGLNPPKFNASSATPTSLPSVPPFSGANLSGILLVSQGALPPLVSQVGSSTPPALSCAESPAVRPSGTKPIG